MKKIVFSFLLFFLLLPRSAFANDHLWDITSVDTMKYSRDAAVNPKVYDLIPTQVKQAADLGISHMAIGTPYDQQFLPVLTAWVKEARKHNLKVWFRGNFSGWEGWFETTKFSDYQVHHQLSSKFITSNPRLFEEGDIFTPVPEPENGAIGDPRKTGKIDAFNQFLIDSYVNCSKAFKQINKQVRCGFFSVNGDIAKQILTAETVNKIGGVVVIDHYVNSADTLKQDVIYLHQTLNAKVMLGEFGAPIPDINGVMTPNQQAQFISDELAKLYQLKNIVLGLNYWVLNGGSTNLVNDDNSLRPVYFALQKYYLPKTIVGTVKDHFNHGLVGVKIESEDLLVDTTSNNLGKFKIIFPTKDVTVKYSRADLSSINQTIGSNSTEINLVMEPIHPDFWYKLKLWFYSWFKHGP